MKTLIFILTLLTYSFFYSQTYSNTNDSIFIQFKNNNSEFKNFRVYKLKNEIREYRFKSKNKMEFYFMDVETIKGSVNRKEMIPFYLTKKEIKKIKNKIIKYKTFKVNMKCDEIKSYFYYKKTIVIDYTEIKDGKIPVYQLKPIIQCPHKE